MAVNQEVYTLETAQSETVKSTDRILDFDLSAELNHGVVVSNLAYAVAVEMGLDEEFCYQMAIAGMLHDIGKLKLTGYINGQERDPLLIEELKYVRMHSSLGYEELKDQGYSDIVLQSILYHHENYDRCTKDRSHGTDIQLQWCKCHTRDQITSHTEHRPAKECCRYHNQRFCRPEKMLDQIRNCDSNE